MILHGTDVRLTGRWFNGLARLTFLKMGVTLSLVQSFGTWRVLNIRVRGVHTDAAHFKRTGWTPSDPGADSTFKFMRFLPGILTCLAPLGQN